MASIALAAAGVFLGAASSTAESKNPPSPPRVSGPYVYAGLDLYLVHGSDALGDRRLVPLAQALEQGKVTVRETGTVSELTVENVSEEEVYIQAGDIVKGGKQDRVMGTDLVLKPKSGPVSIGAHCVEQGRWRQRGSESSDRFMSAQATLNTNDLRYANAMGSQTEVWKNVAKAQKKLAENLGAAVQSSQSATSLQLTLENEHVRAGVEGYVKAFAPLVEAHSDVVGFAFAVDGRLKSADVYASHALFLKLWPKLLRATAAEALAERKPSTAHTPPTLESVRSFLADAGRGSVTEKPTGDGQRSILRETDADLVVETQDAHRSDLWIHKSYIHK